MHLSENLLELILNELEQVNCVLLFIFGLTLGGLVFFLSAAERKPALHGGTLILLLHRRFLLSRDRGNAVLAIGQLGSLSGRSGGHRLRVPVLGHLTENLLFRASRGSSWLVLKKLLKFVVVDLLLWLLSLWRGFLSALGLLREELENRVRC